MSAEPRQLTYTFSFSLLFLLAALACFAAGECLAQGWLTLGTVWQWAFGGFICATLAKLL